MRAAVAIGFLAAVSVGLALVNNRTGLDAGMPAAGRLIMGALVGLIAAAVTISIGLDVIPDADEESLLDLAAIFLAGVGAMALVLRRVR